MGSEDELFALWTMSGNSHVRSRAANNARANPLKSRNAAM